MHKRLFVFFPLCFAFVSFVQGVTAEEEKFTAQTGIIAVSVNGKAFAVHW